MRQMSQARQFLRAKPDLVKQLIEQGLISERVWLQSRAQEIGMGYVDLDRIQISQIDLFFVSRELVTQTRSMPVKRDGNTLWVAISAHDDRQTLDAYKEATTKNTKNTK